MMSCTRVVGMQNTAHASAHSRPPVHACMCTLSCIVSNTSSMLTCMCVRQREDAAQGALGKALGVLEAHLKHRTFLVGHKVTLADIIAASNVMMGFTKVCQNACMHA